MNNPAGTKLYRAKPVQFDLSMIVLVISCTNHSNNAIQSDITDSLFHLKYNSLLFVY